MTRRLFGVRLASEVHMDDRTFDSCLGVVVLRSTTWCQLNLPDVRREICHQLHAVPDSFTFLTSQGFVLLRLS